MKPRIVILLLLLLAVSSAALLQLAAFSSRAQEAPCGAVRPDVLQAVSSDTEVPVIISLPVPPGLLEEVDLGQVRANTAQMQASVLADLDPSDFAPTYQYEIAPALAGRLTATGVDLLDCHPSVTTVALDGDLVVGLTQSIPLIHADHPDIFPDGFDGTDVDVAVIDSGIDTDHPDLILSIIGGECFNDCPNGTDRQSGIPSAEDDHGHGTHVSGIITSDGVTDGIPVGVAPEADIFAYKTQDAGGHGYPSQWLAALDHILANHEGEFEFINMSLESKVFLPPDQCMFYHGTAPVHTIRMLRETETLTFAISGNSVWKSVLAWPGCISDVVSVGGVYDADLGQHDWPDRCTDSTTAPDQVFCASNSADELDLLAPGSEILSTWPFPPYGVAFMSGTSQASPHAVGVAALLLDAEPGLTPDEIVARLKLGPFVTDYFDPSNIRTTPRVDARIVLLPTHGEEDFDQDGCSNQEELGPNRMFGGLRSPLNFWDFFDTPNENNVRDKVVDLTEDLFRVAGRFDANDDGGSAPINRYTDPLSHPPAAPAYHPAFDRGPPVGPNAWNLPPADGIIDLMNDIFGVAAQFDHNCQAPP